MAELNRYFIGAKKGKQKNEIGRILCPKNQFSKINAGEK